MRIVTAALAAALVAGPLAFSPVQAKTDNVWIGDVTHVSTDNIKVADNQGQVLSFMLVPKFKNVWSADGKTTYQMAKIQPGMDVEVIYDQKALGIRHADKIVVLDEGQPIGSIKS